MTVLVGELCKGLIPVIKRGTRLLGLNFLGKLATRLYFFKNPTIIVSKCFKKTIKGFASKTGGGGCVLPKFNICYKNIKLLICFPACASKNYSMSTRFFWNHCHTIRQKSKLL